jgi:tetratricopeptide (TPR) repeat protein
MRKAATELRTAGDEASSRKILEFVFAREIDQRHLSTTNFLGLAEIKIVSGDMKGAMELLHRLVGVVGDPFENLDPAAALLEKSGRNAEAVDFLKQLVKTTPWNGSYKLRLAKAEIAAHTDVNAALDELGKIASDDDYSYNTRTEAAIALVGHEPKNKLGSRELDLLASVTRLSLFAAADQPFFYEARIRAAKDMPNSKGRLKLLRNAVADIPQREDARYLLFEAAANEHADELALAALEGTPAMQGQVSPPTDETPQRFREEMAIRPDRLDTEDEESNSAAAISSSLTREQQTRFSFELAEIYERLGRLSESATRFEAARKLERSAERRREMARRATRVKKELQRLRQNSARRPILHEALEQAHLVRSRIPATAQAAPTNGANQ